MWQFLQIVFGFLLIAAAVGGFILAVYLVGSFVNRIGNPYDKW